MPFLQYFYVFLWVALGVLCLLIGRKQGAVGFLLAGFFGFMAVWYGLRAFAGLPVFEGVWSFVFRAVLLVFLAVIVFVWYRGRQARVNRDPESLPHDEDCHCEHCEEEHPGENDT